jgi:pyruvate-ferredoxin/flavodoxin oxidoreductase
LDHVLASGSNVNILVLDTEVYSNTGGQMSKATPRGAVAKFAASGRPSRKKDLGMMAMRYGNVYVAQVAMGSNDTHTVRTLIEAEQFEGPSLILAYSPCIAHGIDMGKMTDNQKAAVSSGHWPLYRYNPDLIREGKSPMSLDSKEPSIPLKDFAMMETRFSMLSKSDPKLSDALLADGQKEAEARYRQYKRLAEMDFSTEKESCEEDKKQDSRTARETTV